MEIEAMAEQDNSNKSNPLPDFITVEWRVDDVRERAGVLGVELSLDEQRQVLQRVDRHHDANIGICWDVIDNHIDDFVIERLELPAIRRRGNCTGDAVQLTGEFFRVIRLARPAAKIMLQVRWMR